MKNKVNWLAYKFRCSELGYLMTDPRSKSEAISKTTISYLHKIYIREKYGRNYQYTNKEMQKGKYVEEQSLSLVSKFYNELLIKNQEELSNEWIKGTPDIRKPFLGDIKSSWNMETFPAFETECPTDMYYWQLAVGYAWLENLKDGDTVKLIYTLANLPDWMLAKEKKFSELYDMDPSDEEFQKIEEQIDRNFTYDDLPLTARIKVFEMKVNLTDRERLKERVIACRNYLSSLTY